MPYAKVGEKLRHWPLRGTLRDTIGTQHPFIHSFYLSQSWLLCQVSSWIVLIQNVTTPSRTCSHFARAVEVASNIQKNLGMGRLCSDSTERCGAQLEWLPHEGWVPAGSWTRHLPTPVQISESESTLNYQLQRELPNLLTAPISSGACFSTVAGTVFLLQWEPPKWKMKFIISDGKGNSTHILKRRYRNY